MMARNKAVGGLSTADTDWRRLLTDGYENVFVTYGEV